MEWRAKCKNRFHSLNGHKFAYVQGCGIALLSQLYIGIMNMSHIGCTSMKSKEGRCMHRDLSVRSYLLDHTECEGLQCWHASITLLHSLFTHLQQAKILVCFGTLYVDVLKLHLVGFTLHRLSNYMHLDQGRLTNHEATSATQSFSYPRSVIQWLSQLDITNFLESMSHVSPG